MEPSNVGKFGKWWWDIEQNGKVPVGGNTMVCAGNNSAPSIKLKRMTSGIVKGGNPDLCGGIQ
jgi:hypothetical protein